MAVQRTVAKPDDPGGYLKGAGETVAVVAGADGGAVGDGRGEGGASGVVGEELKARGWQEADLARRAKGELDTVKIAGGGPPMTWIPPIPGRARADAYKAGFLPARLTRK